ncbi:hypothetical protein OKW46_007586 [Paraburkholderia sp. WSM4179]|nr:hypothetical protein [Paraburkholderia sp. WSM4179]
MPLYRQAGLLRRFGGDISSNTIAASIVRVGLATQPVINLMRDALLDAELIYCDETTFQVLKEKGRKPQTKSYLWSQMTDAGNPIRGFTYTPGCGAQLVDKLFTGIRKGAVLMTDGYGPYNGIRRAIPARAPWMPGSLPALLRQGRGKCAQSCAPARSARDALHQADRKVVRCQGGSAKWNLREQWPKLIVYVGNGGLAHIE